MDITVGRYSIAILFIRKAAYIGYEPLARDMIWTLQWVGTVLQYYYQKGSLYRLRALGKRHDMDITVGRYSIAILLSERQLI